jgi:hypothetical protein
MFMFTLFVFTVHADPEERTQRIASPGGLTGPFFCRLLEDLLVDNNADAGRASWARPASCAGSYAKAG